MAVPGPDDIHEPERAIREYLTFLERPEDLVDRAEVARWAALVVTASDPIDKLKAIAGRERAAVVDGRSQQADFVVHAHSWAVANEIPVNAFRQMGVPESVLADAGFDVPRAPQAIIETEPAAPERPALAPDVKTLVLSLTAPFTVADIVRQTGANKLTVQRAVKELAERGQIDEKGRVAGHQGPGRAPVWYGPRKLFDADGAGDHRP